jgi:hypothetical protein
MLKAVQENRGHIPSQAPADACRRGQKKLALGFSHPLRTSKPCGFAGLIDQFFRMTHGVIPDLHDPPVSGIPASYGAITLLLRALFRVCAGALRLIRPVRSR